MRILINMHNLVSGGGLTLGTGMIEELLLHPGIAGPHEYLIIVPDHPLYAGKGVGNIQIRRLESFFSTFLGKTMTEPRIRQLCKKERIDKIISLTNYAIPVRGIPQALLIHWPYLVYKEKEVWQNMTWKNKTRRLLRLRKIRDLMGFANTLIVQTEVMKQRLGQITDQPMQVIPAYHNFSVESRPEISEERPVRRLIFPSEYYEHKNHQILLPLAQQLLEEQIPLEIHVTLDAGAAGEFLEALSAEGLDKVIVNLGRLSNWELEHLYPQYDALFFPSLLETFGIPYIEAMHFRLPVLTSDRDFAHTVCGGHAHYFNPRDANDIMRCLKDWTSSEIKSDKSLKSMPSRSEVVKALLESV